MKSLKVGWDACIGAGQRTCHALWLPLWCIRDNFGSSQVNVVDSFSLVKKINAISCSESMSNWCC